MLSLGHFHQLHWREEKQLPVQSLCRARVYSAQSQSRIQTSLQWSCSNCNNFGCSLSYVFQSFFQCVERFTVFQLQARSYCVDSFIFNHFPKGSQHKICFIHICDVSIILSIVGTRFFSSTYRLSVSLWRVPFSGVHHIISKLFASWLSVIVTKAWLS